MASLVVRLVAVPVWLIARKTRLIIFINNPLHVCAKLDVKPCMSPTVMHQRMSVCYAMSIMYGIRSPFI